jgi:Tfp pilus assembly protein PilV
VRRPRAGFALVEALVAMVLAAVAVASLTAASAAAVRHLQVVRARSIALALASDRLESLRAGPRDAGSDEIDVAGVRYVRTWSSEPGRGGPSSLRVEVGWAEGHVRLEGGALP